MSVRSDRLGPVTTIVGAGAAAIFTVPAGQTWLVKRVCTLNQVGLAGNVNYRLDVPGEAPAFLYRVDLTPLGVDDHDAWWALESGASLSLQGFGLSTYVVACFGAKLIGVA